MPFATESDLREEGFLYDVDQVPSERLLESLDKAHEEIVAGTTLTDAFVPTPSVIRAESMLALSHYFRAQAISGAVSAEDVRTNGLRLNDHTRLQHWMTLSQRLWEDAWALLKPHWKTPPPPSLILVKRSES